MAVVRASALYAMYTFALATDSLQEAVRKTRKQKAALQTSIRFVSHECRVPLNSLVLGLDFCSEAAEKLYASAATLRRRRRQRGTADGEGTVGADGTESDGPAPLNERERHMIQAADLLKETLPSLEAAAESMQTTLNDILDLQSIESGRFRIDKKWVRLLPDVLEETRRTFQAQASSDGVRLLQCNIHPKRECELMCDPKRLRGALSNFTSNALKWVRSNPACKASGRSGRHHVVIGASLRPPFLWGPNEWAEARRSMPGSVCDSLEQVVSGTGHGNGHGHSHGRGRSSHRPAIGIAGPRGVTSDSRVHPASSAGRGIETPVGPIPVSPSVARGRSIGSVDTVHSLAETGHRVQVRRLSDSMVSPQAMPFVVMSNSGGDKPASASAGRGNRRAAVTQQAFAAPDTFTIHQELQDASVDSHGTHDTPRGTGMAMGIGMSRSRRRQASVDRNDTEMQGSGVGMASSASSEGTHRIAVHRTAVCLWVLDEGAGIRRKDWGKVFTPFETLHSGILTAEGQGSGLGLAITATVLRLHDGCVGFSSRLGAGSVFYAWVELECREVSSDVDGGGAGADRLVESMVVEASGVSEVNGEDVGMGTGKATQVRFAVRAQAGAATGAAARASDVGVPFGVGNAGIGIGSGSGTQEGGQRVAWGVGVEDALHDGEGEKHGVTSPDASSATDAAAPTLPNSRHMVVLVVDDERSNRVLMVKQVRKICTRLLGDSSGTVEVLEAADGDDAMDILRGRDQAMRGMCDDGMGVAVDLVLTDCNMPRMTGPEMARAIRSSADRGISGIRIVGVTGAVDGEEQADFLEAGAEQVLTKPVRKRELEAVLAQLVGSCHD